MSVKLSFNEPESSYENIAFLPTHIQNRRVQNLNQIGRISIPNFIYHENKTQHFIHRRKKKTEFYSSPKKHRILFTTKKTHKNHIYLLRF